MPKSPKVGLGLTDMQMIHVLDLYGPATPTRLAESIGLSSGGITVALDRLEKAGYILRERHPTDRRSIVITLVPQSLHRQKPIYDGIEKETRRLLKTLPDSNLHVSSRRCEPCGRTAN